MTNSLNTIALTAASFEQDVLRSDTPVLVDFWASWCGPCRAIAPLLEELATEFQGTAAIGKVDVDAEPKLAERYGVRSIPTLLLFNGGRVIEQFVGAVPKHMLAAKLTAAAEQAG